MPDEYGILLAQLIAYRGFDPGAVHGVAIASVVPSLAGTFRRVAADYLRREALVVDAGVKTGVRIRYENPATWKRTRSGRAGPCRPGTAGRHASWTSAPRRHSTASRG